jgi:hypothetical protein
MATMTIMTVMTGHGDGRGDWVDQIVREIWFNRTPSCSQPNSALGLNELKSLVLEKCLRHQHDQQRERRCTENNNDGTGTGTSNISAMISVSKPPHPSMITKGRIKQAKAWIPYQRVGSPIEMVTATTATRTTNLTNVVRLTPKQYVFITSKIQERVACRATREFEQADFLKRGLEAMGVQLDDHNKTWTIVATMNTLQQQQNSSSSTDRTLQGSCGGCCCHFCHKVFPSRNHVFKHLRDPTSGCGTAIFATGQSIPEPPSQEQRRQKKQQSQARRSRRRCHDSNVDVLVTNSNSIDTAQTLWLGDLPHPWTTPRRQFSFLRALLFHYVPKDVPRPWIFHVVRKSYKQWQQQDDDDYNDDDYNNNGEEGQQSTPKLGYAIVVFRDAQEAEYVYQCLNQQKIDPCQVWKEPFQEDIAILPSFTLRVQCNHNQLRTNSNKKNDNDGDAKVTGGRSQQHPPGKEERNIVETPSPGKDPPLEDQLRPLEAEELIRRLKKLGADTDNLLLCQTVEGNKNDESGQDEYQNLLLRRLVQCYQSVEHPAFPRPIVYCMGKPVPANFCEDLLSILEKLRWPARHERMAVTSERYLVLPSNVTNDRFYGHLRQSCRELMNWVDDGFFYSGIAVTKNFVGSPHIDHRDQSFQYAISLGRFTEGGELCIEGYGEEYEVFVNIIDTHNKIARVDGRHVHWVRTWGGGDRYSLIFYNTSDRNVTPIMDLGVDVKFLEG